ncbi:MAG TPA: TolC family protein, partial [Polyangiaceae bacterium LLY-WYZ-15_(1-7)]|nr:TolC family protein [Polyangiaceae bacterium LLY-WYZ-15_(1-7)]
MRAAPAAAFLLLAGPALALAQTRTPTSPLDRPAPPPTTRPASPPSAPNAPSPVTTAPRVDLRVPAAPPPGAPLEALLPPLPADGLDLVAITRRALEEGVAARRAALGEVAAEASLREARRGFVPRASLSFRYTRLSDYTPGRIGTFDTPGCLADLAACQAAPESFQREVVLQEPILDQYALSTRVSAPLSEWVGAQRHRLRAARADLEASAADAEARRLDVAYAAQQAFWERVRAETQLELARESRAVASGRAEQARARREVGTAAEVEALAAAAQVRSYARLVEVAELRVELADARLRDLLRWPEGEPLPIAPRLLPLPAAPEALNELTARAREGSPRLAAQRARADAADARADAHRAAQMPSLSVAFGSDTANPNQRIFPQETEFTTTWDLSVQLAWSLDGALLEGARRQRERALAEAERLGRDETRDALRRDVLQARGDLAAALLAVEARHAAAHSAARAAEDADARADAGVSTAVDRAAAAAE